MNTRLTQKCFADRRWSLWRLFRLAFLALCFASGGAAVAADPSAYKNILFFSKCSDYEDNMVHREKGQLGLAEQILGGDFSKENRFHFTFTKDGAVFTPEYLASFDTICFFTSGDLTQSGRDQNPPMSPAGKAALLAAIRDGKGFVGIHSAAATFVTNAGPVDPYIQMLGGQLFNRVRGMEPAHQIVVDPHFPGFNAVPADFGPVDEWYQLRHFSPDLHVLLLHDTATMVRGSYYGTNFPSTWVQPYGRGRVFYTSMGHEEAVWRSPVFQQMLLGGLQWTTGRMEADVSPNLVKVAPALVGQ